MIAAWRKFYADHGTKFLGIFEAVTGLVEFVDANTINLVGGFFGDHWGPIISKALQIGAGLLVARRGYQNTRRASVEP